MKKEKLKDKCMSKKKSFTPNTEMNIREIANNFENIDPETKKDIEKLEKNPSIENADNAVDKIGKDKLLDKYSKNILIDTIRNNYITAFNLENIPDNYDDLKKEAKFFAGMTGYSFVLMAQRLIKIREKELYKQGGYLDFKTFIIKEIGISKGTAYNYIDLFTLFGVKTFGLSKDIDPSKLIPAIPLLKAKEEKINNQQKENIKKRFIEESKDKNKTARDIKAEADVLKKEYKLTQPTKTKKTDFIKLIFVNIKKNVQQGNDRKKTIENIVEYLKKSKN